MKIILIGVWRSPRWSLLEALVYTLRFLARPAERTS